MYRAQGRPREGCRCPTRTASLHQGCTPWGRRRSSLGTACGAWGEDNTRWGRDNHSRPHRPRSSRGTSSSPSSSRRRGCRCSTRRARRSSRNNAEAHFPCRRCPHRDPRRPGDPRHRRTTHRRRLLVDPPHRRRAATIPSRSADHSSRKRRNKPAPHRRGRSPPNRRRPRVNARVIMSAPIARCQAHPQILR